MTELIPGFRFEGLIIDGSISTWQRFVLSSELTRSNERDRGGGGGETTGLHKRYCSKACAAALLLFTSVF